MLVVASKAVRVLSGKSVAWYSLGGTIAVHKSVASDSGVASASFSRKGIAAVVAGVLVEDHTGKSWLWFWRNGSELYSVATASHGCKIGSAVSVKVDDYRSTVFGKRSSGLTSPNTGADLHEAAALGKASAYPRIGGYGSTVDYNSAIAVHSTKLGVAAVHAGYHTTSSAGPVVNCLEITVAVIAATSVVGLKGADVTIDITAA